MMYENIKSIILTILVLVSLFLTWNIWTYQPVHDLLKNEELIQDVSIKETEEIPTLLRPSKLLVHHDSIHYGTEEQQEIERLVKEMKKWKLFKIEQISPLVGTDFQTFMHGRGKVEIIFPDDIPLASLSKFLQFQEELQYPMATVDRIVIDVETNRDNPIVYLVNYEERVVYEALASGLNIANFESSFYRTSVRYRAYRTIDITEEKKLFVQSGEVKMSKLHFLADMYSPEDFKNALFSDPSRVTRELGSVDDVYTDGYRLMTVEQNKAKLNFVNPINADVMSSNDISKFNVIEAAIGFVNEHSGWTDKYLFDSWNRDFRDHTATFRLHVNGFPVFNGQGLAEIKQVWRNNEIFQYIRPLFELKFTVDLNESTVVTLPSSDVVVAELRNLPGFNIENLQNIKVFYDLRRDLEQDGVFILEPIWAYQYNDTWRKVNFSQKEHLGGM